MATSRGEPTRFIAPCASVSIFADAGPADVSAETSRTMVTVRRARRIPMVAPLLDATPITTSSAMRLRLLSRNVHDSSSPHLRHVPDPGHVRLRLAFVTRLEAMRTRAIVISRRSYPEFEAGAFGTYNRLVAEWVRKQCRPATRTAHRHWAAAGPPSAIAT